MNIVAQKPTPNDALPGGLRFDGRLYGPRAGNRRRGDDFGTMFLPVEIVGNGDEHLIV